MKFFSTDFWSLVFCKIVETLISVKVWILISTFIFSAWIVKISVSFSQWDLIPSVITFLSTVVCTITVMREGFKISTLSKKSSDEVDKMIN